MRRAASLLRDARGISAVEFGLIAPFMIALVLGTLQLALDVAAKSVLTGAVQEAGRNSGIEDAHLDQSAIDSYVRKQVQAYLPTATLSFTRKNYQNFSDVGTPEDFTDTNKNGEYDDDECFADENGNNQWDADSGASGQGGARDVVLYTATMEYNEVVPVYAFLGLGKKRKLSSSTTLMNQPFSTQADRVVKQVCP
jgi:Flp pilus assembly protein TadG